MNRINISYMNHFDKTTYTIPKLNTYTVNQKGNKFRKFIGDLLFKLLSKISNVKQFEEYKTEVTVKQVGIDLSSIEKMIWEHTKNIECIYNKRCRMIVLGYKQMEQLGNEVRQFMSFNFPSNYQSQSYFNNRPLEFAGIEVVVVPWIDGAFAIPNN